MSRRADLRLRLATWNIHSGIGGDGYHDMERIVSVLKEIDADVVGLQEVGWHRRTHHRIDHFAYLRDHTGYTVVEGLVRDPLRAQFGNALLTRLPLAALFAELRAESLRLQMTVLHLGLTVWERERQVRRLLETLSRQDAPQREGATEAAPAEEAAPPSVLLGDFNMLRRRTRASAILAERFPTCVRKPTYPTRRPQLSLDRIYLSPHWEVTEERVFAQGAALDASDHLPLIADARL